MSDPDGKWLDRLHHLHPLLRPGPRVSAWAERQAEIDAASEAERAAARAASEKAARRREREYDNDVTTWAAVLAILLVAGLGLWLVFHLIAESRLEDCLLAHRHNCDRGLE